MVFKFEVGELVYIKEGAWNVMGKDLSEFSNAFGIIKTREDNEIGMGIGVPYRIAYELELLNMNTVFRENIKGKDLGFIPEHFLSGAVTINKTDIDKNGNLV